MQFQLTGRDGTDEGAFERRLAVREQHIKSCDDLFAAGRMLFGVALLDGKGKMIGSTMILDFDTRAAFDAWLETEPYVVGNVWDTVEVTPCKIGPTFTKLFDS